MVIPELCHGYSRSVPWSFQECAITKSGLCHIYAGTMPWSCQNCAMVIPGLCHGYSRAVLFLLCATCPCSQQVPALASSAHSWHCMDVGVV